MVLDQTNPKYKTLVYNVLKYLNSEKSFNDIYNIFKKDYTSQDISNVLYNLCKKNKIKKVYKKR